MLTDPATRAAINVLKLIFLLIVALGVALGAGAAEDGGYDRQDLFDAYEDPVQFANESEIQQLQNNSQEGGEARGMTAESITNHSAILVLNESDEMPDGVVENTAATVIYPTYLGIGWGLAFPDHAMTLVWMLLIANVLQVAGGVFTTLHRSI